MKSDGKPGRYYLKGSIGDAMNIILSGAGQNIRKLLKLLATLLHFFAFILVVTVIANASSAELFMDD